MKKVICILLQLAALYSLAQDKDSLSIRYKAFDTVTITALGRQSYQNIPYSLQQVAVQNFSATPRPQLMGQLSRIPSVSTISSGSGINKPVIRGLSFNHIQLFAQGTRVDNQTWDDRHDIGIADNGYDKVEVINGPAALLYGPNSMGGAMIFSETPPALHEKTNGYVQLGFFGNTMGTNLNAGLRQGKEHFYYSVHAAAQVHANYVQGGGKNKKDNSDEEGKPLAFNSKYTNAALKAMVGTRNDNGWHQLQYSAYQQMLGIIEDESMEALNNPAKKEERDYEMEAPYQDVLTHIISTENNFKVAKSNLFINAAYQFNNRKEYEPGATPKSKYLGVGLDLSTLTGSVQWQTSKSKNAGITLGVQGFYQSNTNKGNWVLVPDAHISTLSGFAIGHLNLAQWNFLAGVRVDRHQLKMYNTPSPLTDTIRPALVRPQQQLTRKYTPASFSLGTVFHASERLSIKLNLANGFAAPNYAQLTAFGRHEGTYRFEVGDNNLEMEKNTEGDLAFLWEGAGISAGLNGYINSIKNYIFISPTADSIKPYRIYKWVQHDAQISGLEAHVLFHPQTAKWIEGYIRGGLIRGQLASSGGDLPYIPANKLLTGISVKKDVWGAWKKLYATLEVSNYGRQTKVAQFETATNGYTLTDIFLGAMPPLGKHQRWSAVAFCTNVMNVGYFNHLSLIKAINVKEAGRNIGLQLRYGW